MFGRLLLCQLVPKSQLHPNLWKGANRRFKAVPQNKIAANQLKKPKTETQWTEKIAKENKKRADQAQKLKEMGYEFEPPALKAAQSAVTGKEAPKAIEAAKEEEASPEAAVAISKPAKEAKQNAAKTGGKAKKPKAKKAKA